MHSWKRDSLIIHTSQGWNKGASLRYFLCAGEIWERWLTRQCKMWAHTNTHVYIHIWCTMQVHTAYTAHYIHASMCTCMCVSTPPTHTHRHTYAHIGKTFGRTRKLSNQNWNLNIHPSCPWQSPWTGVQLTRSCGSQILYGGDSSGCNCLRRLVVHSFCLRISDFSGPWNG